MTTPTSHALNKQGNLWIISTGRYARFDLSGLTGRDEPVRAKEFHISALGRYLLDPAPIDVPGRLVGGRLRHKPFAGGKMRRWSAFRPHATPPAETTQVVSALSPPLPLLATPDLERHMLSIHKRLQAFDPAHARLAEVDAKTLADVDAICEDDAGNRSEVKLTGAPGQRLDYVRDNLGRTIHIRLDRAQISDGLFDMRGFDFQAFDASVGYRLLRVTLDGQEKACVLRANNTVDFWLDTPRLIHWLQVIQLALTLNPQMNDSFVRCMNGRAKALRLMINADLAIDYQNARVPAVFREVSRNGGLPPYDEHLLKRYLNTHQIGVSFNALAVAAHDSDGVVTDMSVLQDMRALDEIKASMPELYAEIDKRAQPVEAGRLYILESVRGPT